jgi:hypothetical protein
MKRLVLGLVGVFSIVAAAWTLGVQAGTPAHDKAPPDGRFRVTVNEVLREDTTISIQVGVDALPGSYVDVNSDKPDRGGVGSASPPPAHPHGSSHTQVVVFADHVVWEAGSVNALKFVMRAQGSPGSGATMSNTGPMPEGKRLMDVVKVLIEPGEYPYGVATKLVTFKDVTYSLVVRYPK